MSHVEESPQWELLAMPIGNMNLRRAEQPFGPPVLPELVGPGTPLPPSVRLRQIPAYGLRAPKTVFRPELSPRQTAALRGMARGRSRTQESADWSAYAQKSLARAFAVEPSRPRVHREIVARAITLGVLEYEEAPVAWLSGRRARALASLALGGDTQLKLGDNYSLVHSTRAENIDNLVIQAFAVGALVVLPPYEPGELETLAALPDVLRTTTVPTCQSNTLMR